MAPEKYPIGIQTFEEIRQEGYRYADKTSYIYQLISSGAKHVFLSRPRRFGKSLFISTLQAYFEGRKDLFEGLEIEKLEKEWKSYPVLRFSFAGLEAKDCSKVEEFIHHRIKEYERKFDVENTYKIESISDRFGILIRSIAEKTGKKVVILIDEYDKGIVELLHDKERLEKNIDLFRSFYSQLKDQDHHLRFVFLTGVSRFRNLTLFSSNNQMQDITMNPKYAAICGLTADELHTIFAKGIQELAEDNEISVEETKYRLKLKYDSYRFTRKKEYVYNPFSILNCFSNNFMGNYWITSGPSKVFVDYLMKSDYNLEEIENMWVPEEVLGGHYSTSNPVPLLFQTGYLTITDYDDGVYRLGIPNGEVRSALVDQLAPEFLGINSERAFILSKDLGRLANRGDADGLMRMFQTILSHISHQHFKLNDVENVYNLSVWLICKMAGIDAQSEVSVAGGDIDLLIKTPNYIYVIEFKKDQRPQKALDQIENKGYAIPWSADGRTVYKIGAEFSSTNRNITDWIIA